MFFALSLVFVFIALYFLIYSKSDSSFLFFENYEEETKIEENAKDSAVILDFETLLMPDELYILL